MNRDELVKTVDLLKALAIATPQGLAAFVQAGLFDPYFGLPAISDRAAARAERGLRQLKRKTQ